MTPHDIQVLIHCHCFPVIHPRIKAPAVKTSLSMLWENQLIEPNGHDIFRTTEKGRFLIEMICDTPFPEVKIVDPRVGL